MTTVGVVGIGRWGRNLVRCFDAVGTVAYCCHTGDESNAARVREACPGATLTTSYDRVLEDGSVDAVAIATPVGTHAALARRAIEAGADVFVEKPLAVDGETARELVALADDRGRKLFTGYVFLYAPAMRELAGRLADDPAVHLRATWETFGTFDAPVEQSLACHDVAIGQYLLGEPFERATVTERAGVRTATDLLGATFETASSRRLTAAYDRTAREDRKSLVAVTESGARYEFVDDRLVVLAEDGHETVVGADAAEPLRAECEAFVRWVEGGRKPPTAGAFGARVSEVLDLL